MSHSLFLNQKNVHVGPGRDDATRTLRFRGPSRGRVSPTALANSDGIAVLVDAGVTREVFEVLDSDWDDTTRQNFLLVRPTTDARYPVDAPSPVRWRRGQSGPYVFRDVTALDVPVVPPRLDVTPVTVAVGPDGVRVAHIDGVLHVTLPAGANLPVHIAHAAV